MADERVGILIELEDPDHALETIKKIESSVKSLGSKKATIKLDDGSLVSVDERIKEIQDKLVAMRSSGTNKILDHGEVKTAKQLNSELKVLQRGLKDGVSQAKQFKQVFNSMSSQIAHFGGSMQTLGNAMQRISSPFARITTGLLYGVGYKALNLFTEGISNAFERADTMKNYDRALKALGMDTEKTFSIAGREAMTAKQNLDEAVQGLPTSLDEIMAKQKIYAGATGEMVSSTATAIAANNTALASGMDARSQLYMQRYLTALSSGAELTTTQWQSMARIAPLAMRQVAKELGYADNEYAQFNKDVQKGTVSGQEFLKAFQKVGTEGKVADAARAMTESWSGLFSNIRIAVTRMGANILDTLNETFKDASGRTLLQHLLGWDAEGKDMEDGIRSWINKQSEAIQNWIKANPDKILDFFEALKSIDVAGFLKGLAQGLGDIANVAKFFADIFGGNLRGLSRFMIDLNMIGKGLTVTGGVLRGLRFPLAWLGAKARFAGSGTGGGLFGKIASFFGGKKSITAAESVGKAVTKASPSLISAFKNIALISGIIAIPTATAWGVTAATKASIKNFKETINLLKDIDWNDAKKLLLGIGGFLGATTVIGGIIGKISETGVGGAVLAYTAFGTALAGIITSIATGFAALDMSFIKSGIKNFVDSVKLLNEIPDLTTDSSVIDKIKNAIAVMNEVSEAFNGKDDQYSSAKEGGSHSKGLGGMDLLKRWGINNLASALKSLNSMISDIQSLSTATIPDDAVDNIGNLIGSVKEIANKLGSFASITGLSEAISSSFIKTTMANIADELIQLRRMAYHINALAAVEVNAQGEVNATKILGVASRLAKAFGRQFGDWTGYGLANRASSGNIKKTMTNVVNQLIQLRRMAYHINKLAGTTVDEGGFKATVQQIKDALASLKDIEGDLELDIEVKLSDAFGDSVTKVIKKIASAKKKILKYNNKTINVRIPVSVTFAVTTNFASALAGLIRRRNRLQNVSGGSGTINVAKGGMVYRSKGGGIPNFKRRGTDTIPAMLSPGEYVHNKRAVNTFGIDFMRKVNSLDVKGAMNELMHRAGGMANINRGTTITNNYNNNQKVVINNSNNAGAGFTFKSASRFVGAF